MGIYLFNRKVLEECLDNTHNDFGKHIIPTAIKDRRVHAYNFHGYWEDIGTIRSFFQANLDLCKLCRSSISSTPPRPSSPTHAPCPPRRSTVPPFIRRSSPTAASSPTRTSKPPSSASARKSRPARPSATCIIMGADFYAGAAARIPPPAARHRPQLPHRARHHRQKRPHRRQRGHHARRQARRDGR
jgi:glucose-1-phosphate adenylyltransferase